MNHFILLVCLYLNFCGYGQDYHIVTAKDVDIKDNGIITSIGEGLWDYQNIIIEDEVGGIEITGIGKGTFYEMGLNTVMLPESLTMIDALAFCYNNLDSLDLKKDIRTIGEFAFFENKIIYINFPKRLTVINEGVFKNNLLSELVIPENIDSIKASAFCNNVLTNLHLHNGLVYIGPNAFGNNNFNEENIPVLPDPGLINNNFLYWQSFKRGGYHKETKKYDIIDIAICKPGEKIDLELGYRAIFNEK